MERISVNKWIEKSIENGELDPNQVIAVYEKDHFLKGSYTLRYIGKADFAPFIFWEKFRCAEMVGHELRINCGE